MRGGVVSESDPGDDERMSHSVSACARPSPTWTARLLVFATLLGLLLSASPSRAQALDIKEWLRRPGVRLVVVEFYATWCKPCMAAVPKWKALHERYRNDGLRLIVVNTQDPDGRCVSPGWNPNESVCDEEGLLSRQWGGGKQLSLPSAFLWSWQGNLLTQRGHVGEVEQAVRDYLRTMPRVAIEVAEGTDKALLRGLVRSKIAETGKIQVAAGLEERSLLGEIRKRSRDPRYSDKSACKPGEEMAANSLLRVKVAGSGSPRLFLELQNAETGCLSAAGSAAWNKLKPSVSVAEAVDRLLSRLRRERIQLPGAASVRTALSRSQRPGMLRLEVDQAGTEYRVEGTELKGKLKSGEKRMIDLPMRSNPYRIVFSKKGFLPYEASVRLDENTPVQRIAASLMRDVVKAGTSKEQGWLIVKSDPENAEIFLDGVLQQRRTPDTLDVPAGPHALRIRRKRYLDWTGEVTVPKDDQTTVSATLVPDFARLAITAEPPDAEIFLNGRRVGVGRYEKAQQPSGGYALRITAPLHATIETEVFVEPGKDTVLRERLVPRFGVLELDIETEVEDKAGATPRVFVDGAPVSVDFSRSSDGSRFTARLERIASGEHTVEVQLKRFSPSETTVTVTDGGTARVEATLSARFGTLVVTSDPSGLPVLVNGTRVGVTPLERDEDVGSHTVEVPGESYHRPFKSNVLLRKQSTETVHAALVERHGGLAVASSPPDAELFLDGVSIGRSPVTKRDVRVGSRRVEARREGFTPTVLEIDVEEGETHRALVELKSLGAVDVRCLAPDEDLDGVRMWLAGEAWAGASHRFEAVATGTHEVICESPRGHRVTRRVEARPGHAEQVVLDLTDPAVLVKAYEAARSPYQLAGWSLIGAAVAGGVAGGVTYYLAQEQEALRKDALGEFAVALDGSAKVAASERMAAAQSSRNGYATGTIVSAVLSSAALVGGIVVLLLGPSPSPEIEHLVQDGAPKLQLGATPSASGFTFTLDGRF